MDGGPRKPFGGGGNANAMAKRPADHLKHHGKAGRAAPRDYILPPLPDEDDDLLSHYACPKYTYEPLPYDLFPGPDAFAEQERQNAARFPCFKYYDLSVYTLEEARKLSAIDLIPKDALKKNDQQHMQRTKRAKRITAEPTHLAGYYRNKNDGVEMSYGGTAKETGTTGRLGAKTRRLAAQQQAAADAAVNPGSSRQNGQPPLPKKQGNRLDFLANLRRQMGAPAGPPRTMTPTASSATSSLQPPLWLKKSAAGGAKSPRGVTGSTRADTAASRRPATQRSRRTYEEDDRASVHSTASSASTGDSENDQDEEYKAKGSSNAIVAPAWIADTMEKDEKVGKVALAVIAHEELGASDEDDF